MEHTNVVAVIAVLNFFPFDRNADFLLCDRLKRVRLGQWNPEPRFAFDFGELDPINEFELVRAFDDLGLSCCSYCRSCDQQQRQTKRTARSEEHTSELQSR